MNLGCLTCTIGGNFQVVKLSLVRFLKGRVKEKYLEETGVEVTVGDMLPFPYAVVRHYRDKDLQALILCFICEYRSYRAGMRFPEKVSERYWFRSIPNAWDGEDFCQG
jgi:hypothetical protein